MCELLGLKGFTEDEAWIILGAIIKARLVENVSNVIGDEIISTVVIVDKKNFMIVNKHVEIVEIVVADHYVLVCVG
jgi:hypothetical protein